MSQISTETPVSSTRNDSAFVSGEHASSEHAPILNDVIIRIAGDGGEGVRTTGEFLAIALGRLGLHIFKIESLPAEIKGGPSMFQLRVGETTPKSQGSHLDILVCFNDEVYQIHKADLKPNTGRLIPRRSSSADAPSAADFGARPRARRSPLRVAVTSPRRSRGAAARTWSASSGLMPCRRRARGSPSS